MTSRLFALLVLLTLVPAAFVLWFMNAAVTAERESAQQRVREAYRGQLRLVRARLDPLWRAHAARLSAAGAPTDRFEELVTGGLAEGVVVLDASGNVRFPDREARRRLQQMDDLRARDRNVFLPTQAALRLSVDLVDAERVSPLPGTLRETSIAGVWALSSDDGRVVALYRTGRLEEMMHDFLHQVETPGVAFIAFPPDEPPEPADSEAIAAGSWLPGWQLSYVPLDGDARAADAARRRTFYIAAALTGIVLIVLAGLAVTAGVRRHLRLARLKTDLVAAASHELRTPLASTAVLVDGLLADAHPDPIKMREYLQLIAAENTRLSRVVENFLTFARADRGAVRLTFGPVDPASVIRAAIDSVGARVPGDGALRVEVSPDLPRLLADSEALRGALVNLIDNALKYTTAEKRIVVRARADGADHVRFEVADNGIGIPRREQRRIFRRFHRVDTRLAGTTTGVGLGLSIVDAIARAHGGSVSVHSAPGAGSTFALRLPCLPPGAVA
ncbi:MAG TPA: HAMP domain-containing sensor histidine kinase [Vicinamibacterales bacterium]|nr:HAMP domain-containing sensor histidine kinase [Vicinamibacterales bacterium]